MTRRRDSEAPRQARPWRVVPGVMLALSALPLHAMAQSSAPPPPSEDPSSSVPPPNATTSSGTPTTTSSGAPGADGDALSSSPPVMSATAGPPTDSHSASEAPGSSAPPITPTRVPPVPPTVDAVLERFAGSHSVITRRDIARTDPISTIEMLRYVPGLQLREDDPFGLRPNFGLRGLDPQGANTIAVLEDGVPIALGPYGQPDAAYLPPIELVNRIEVVRGAGTLVFGPQMVGGTINFVTPGPPARETWSLRALAGYPLMLGASGVYGNRVGNASFLLGAVRRQGDGPRHDPFEITEVLGRFRLEMGSRSDLTARVEVFDQGATLSSVGLTTPMFENVTYRSLSLAPNDWTRLRRYAAAVVHEFRIADNIRLRTVLHGAAYERHAWQQQFDRVPVDSLWYARIVGPTGTPGGALYFRDSNGSAADSHQVIGLEPRLQAGFRLASFRNELDIGGRVQFERAEITTLRGGSQFARTGDARFSELHEGFGVAAYVSDRVYFTDAWQLTAAVRFESFSFSAVTRRVQGMDVSARGQSSNIGLLPGGTLAFVQPNFTFFAGAHGGWIPTRFDQALEPTRGMIAIEPETSVNSEVGARVQVADALHGELTGFWIERFKPIVPYTRSDGTPGWGNGNPVRHLGVEALLQLDIGHLANIATNVYLNATYQFVDARVQALGTIPTTCLACDNSFAGHIMPYVSPHTLTATLGIEHPIGFGAQASYRFASDRFSDLANTATPGVDGRVGLLPAYHGLDVSVRYTHPETGLGITLGAKNVLDMQWIASRAPDGIQPGGYRQLFVAIRWDR